MQLNKEQICFLEKLNEDLKELSLGLAPVAEEALCWLTTHHSRRKSDAIAFAIHYYCVDDFTLIPKQIFSVLKGFEQDEPIFGNKDWNSRGAGDPLSAFPHCYLFHNLLEELELEKVLSIREVYGEMSVDYNITRSMIIDS